MNVVGCIQLFCISSRDFRSEENNVGTKPGRYRLLRSDDGEDELEIVAVRPADAGLYTCHVDFQASPTLKTYVEVSVIGKYLRWLLFKI